MVAVNIFIIVYIHQYFILLHEKVSGTPIHECNVSGTIKDENRNHGYISQRCICYVTGQNQALVAACHLLQIQFKIIL